MDLSALMTTLLSSDSVKNLSKATGATKSDVTSVLSTALPMLLEGVSGQANNKESGFAGALAKHAVNDTTDLAGFFGNIDLEDGAKIIGHLLGGKAESSTKTVAKKTGVSASSTGKILAAAAPLLMSLLGQQTSGSKNDTADSIGDLIGAVLANVDVGDLLSGLLGGGKSTSKKKAADDGFGLDDVGDILTKLLK